MTSEFHPPRRILLGPGPSNVDDRVLRAMSAPLVGHLDPLFLRVMDEVQDLLRHVFETQHRVTIPISGTGSAGMEAAFANLIEPGEEVLVGCNGYFGERMYEMVGRVGGKVIRIEAPWGEAIPKGRIAEALKDHPKARLLALVHAETSTGVLQPLEGLRELLADRDGILIVDTVTSLGGHPVGVDRHGIDVCYSGTQKALSCPPGLAPITFSERALAKVKARPSKVQSWYLDITLIDQYWGKDRVYHHTAPVSMVYALREALRIINEEGLEARWARHQLNHRALVAGLEAMGLELFVPPEHRLWTLNTVKIPEGVDDARVRRKLLETFDIEIGGGLGPLKGRIWRIGLMGSGSTANHVLLLLGALEQVLASEGFKGGSGVSAANAVYGEAKPSLS